MLLLITLFLPSSISLLTTRVKLWLFNTKLSFRVRIVRFWLTLRLSLTFDCSIEGLECGGAYLKLLKENADLHAEEFSNASPYVIMFGPDKCGATNKVRNSTGSCFAVILITVLGSLHLQAQESQDWRVRGETSQEPPYGSHYQAIYPLHFDR